MKNPFLNNRVQGLPAESDWPEGVSIQRSAFGSQVPQPLEGLIPEMDQMARDLMEVCQSYFKHNYG